MPLDAALLGYGGAIPFVALALATISPLPFLPAAVAREGLLAYAAVILSFLGGIHWGIAFSGSGKNARAMALRTGSVLPALAAWLAVWIGGMPGHLALLVLFVVLGLWDIVWRRHFRTPDWYMTLRAHLTAIVSLALLAALVLGRG